MHGSMKHRRATLSGIGVAVAAALALGVTPARADVVTVNPFACATGGGSVSLPAGSTIVVRQGLAEQARGILIALLQAQTTTLTIDGGPAVDISDDWTDLVQMPDGSWQTAVEYPTGITLTAGQSLTLVFAITLEHQTPEVVIPPLGGDGGKPAFNVPGTQAWACTVTGV